MKFWKSLVLLALCLGAFEANAQVKNSEIPQKNKSKVELNSNRDVFDNSIVREKFIKYVPKEVRDYIKNVTNLNLSYESYNGYFIVVSCKPHSCNTDGFTALINLADGNGFYILTGVQVEYQFDDPRFTKCYSTSKQELSSVPKDVLKRLEVDFSLIPKVEISNVKCANSIAN